MNSKSASSSADLTAPMPARQFWGFLLFFHIVYLGMLALTLFAHLHRVTGALGTSGFTLIGLVVIQSLLYVCFFALPSLAEHGGAQRWFGVIFRDMNELDRANPRLAVRWFAGFLVVSVALVLAECRIEPAFQWALIAYVGMISALPFRISVPGTMAIIAAFLLNWLGWKGLVSWRIVDALLMVVPMSALILLMGRTIVTSGDANPCLHTGNRGAVGIVRSRLNDKPPPSPAPGCPLGPDTLPNRLGSSRGWHRSDRIAR